MLGMPSVLFLGFVRPESLTIGSVLVRGKTLPAARLVLRQRMTDYEIVATGSHYPAEFYAYCSAARHAGLKEIHSFMNCHLLKDDDKRLVLLVSGVWWYAPDHVRQNAPYQIVQFMSGEGDDLFEFCQAPFFSISGGE